MKKLITIITILLLFNITKAQITIQREDFAAPGEWYKYGHDTVLTSVTSLLLTEGANQTWDVRSLFTTHYTDTVFFVDGMRYPTAPAGCNLVEFTIDPETNERTETFYAVSNRELRIIFDGSEDVPPGALKLLTFPSTYQTSFRDSFSSHFTALAEDFGLPTNPLFDSVKILFNISINSIIDGWGKLQFTDNIFDVLRQKSTLNANVQFLIRNRFTGQYSPLPGFPEQNEQNISYAWFGQNSGNYYLQIITDADGNINDTKFLLASSRGVINSTDIKKNIVSNIKTWPNPANEYLNLSFSLNQSDRTEITIFDVNGKEVYADYQLLSAGENSLQLSINNIPSGLYFYSIKGDNLRMQGKFLKD